MAARIVWPGINIKQCDVVQVLQLSGLAPSNRQAKIYVKSGWVFLNTQPVLRLKSLMNLNEYYTLEVRLPSGIIKSLEIIVIERMYK